ncbi:MAG: MCE family protein [Verrucomicrobia bacterium]|nr:MCE family protein [Verrucomicrobiota bacterium]
MNAGRSRKTRLALIVFLGAALILFAGLFFGVEDNPFRKPPLAFSIRFDDVTGIREHSRVYFLGIPVGYVTRLDYAPGPGAPAVKVDVVVTRKLPIPATVTAHLEPTLLGDASIALRLPEPENNAAGQKAGVSSEPAAGFLANGSEIRGERSTKLEAVMPGFDAAMARLETFALATGERLSEVGTMVDRSVTNLNLLFLQKGPDGRTPIDSLVVTLEELINGPEGKQDESVRSQLAAIVTDLRASSDNVKRLSDWQGNDQGSVGQLLQTFEDAARKVREDALAAQKVIAKMGRTSDAISRASNQVDGLAARTAQTVDEFHSRPLHFLTTTHPPIQPNQAPAAVGRK